MELNKYEVSKKSIRLDVFLANKIKTLSRTKISEFIRQEGVGVNESCVKKPSYILQAGDEVTFSSLALEGFTRGAKQKSDLEAFGDLGDKDLIKPQAMELNILHEDDDILVLDKPSGLVVHPGVGNYDGTLVNGLAEYFKNKGLDLPNRVGLVHRLDKEVSGLMVIAKNNESLSMLSEQFRGDKDLSFGANKIYWAVVSTADLESSSIKGSDYKVEGYISRSSGNRKKFVLSKISSKGRYSLSYVNVLKKGKKHSLLEIRIVTGRTHQIRVHLSSLKVPIIGDTLYNGVTLEQSGIALRCVRLDIIHPEVYKELIVKGFIKYGDIQSQTGKDQSSNVERVSFSSEMIPLSLEV